MSVMLTKFESKSNRVKGELNYNIVLCCEVAQYLFQGLHFIQRNHYSQQHFTMVVCNSGITVWVFWWTDLKNTRVSAMQCTCRGQEVTYSKGPVRGVAIHPSRALLVTGGDDYKIKVWGQCN